MDNYKITVVIPTIWSSDLIYESVEKLEKNEAVGEILLINNRPESCKKPLESSKLTEHIFPQNLFVNPAWNFGVKNAKYEKVCLLNDDVIVDDLAFYYALFLLDTPSIGVVGTSKSSFKSRGTYGVEKISVRNRGFGIMMFFRKSTFTPIPEDLKIWFGDDWMIKTYEDRVYRMNGPYIKTVMSSSSESPEFKKIVDQDVQNSLKYHLPWSNDFED